MKGKHVHIFKDQNTHSPEEPEILRLVEQIKRDEFLDLNALFKAH